MNRSGLRWMMVAAVMGALAVALGAFAAHGLPNFLAEQGASGADLARRLANFDTAARYQSFGALFLLGLALALDREPRVAWRVACWGMLLGIVIFSGVLYGVAIASPDWQKVLGRFAPLGGSLMILAWVAAGVGAMPHVRPSAAKNGEKLT